MKKAIIDIGTNSTRLLIAQKEAEKWQKVLGLLEFTRIGENIGRKQVIKPEPLARTARCVADYVRRAQEQGCTEIVVTATSAVRDAANREEVCAYLKEQCAQEVRVLRGEEEAYLSYLGAVGTPDEETAVLDIGGGSTELVYPQEGGLHVMSVAVGAVRLKERAELRQDLAERLKPLVPEERPLNKLVAVGGTATTLAALKLGLEEYDSELVQQYPLSKAEVDGWLEKLAQMSVEEIKKLKGMPAKRADVIYYGVLILSTIMELAKLEQVWAEDRDLMYGLLEE